MPFPSEKEIYAVFFQEAKCKFPRIEEFIWGEDLIDYKIKLYMDGKESIPEFMTNREEYSVVGVVAVNPKVSGMVRIVSGVYSSKEKTVYLKDRSFGEFWVALKKSISVGINNNPEKCRLNGIKKPEDLIELNLLNKGLEEAYFDEGIIKYRQIKPESAKALENANRQRIMSNPKLVYVYSKTGKRVHDKTCAEIKFIADHNLRGRETFPEGRAWCPECQRIGLIRTGCENFQKQIPICNRFLNMHHVSTETIEEIVEAGVRFHATDLKCLRVLGHEDSWEIRVSEDGCSLWHNNYVRISSNERYITSGFHNQGLDDFSVSNMLRFIGNYSWEKHLASEEAKKQGYDNTEMDVQKIETDDVCWLKKQLLSLKLFFEGIITNRRRKNSEN